MRRYFLCLLAVAATILTTTAHASTPALRVPTRAVPVYEDTAAPGASSLYTLCSLQDNTVFANTILSASNECAYKTSFSWTDGSLPTTAQRKELCTCTQLMKQLQTLTVPRCSLYRGGQLVSYAQFIAYSFGLCNVDGTIASSTTTTTGSGSGSKISSSTATSNSPSTDGSTTGEAKKSSKAPLIGGIIAGVVVCVIIAFFLGRRRRTRRKSDAEHAVTDHDVIQAMPLSPIESTATNTVYTATPLTPTTDSRKSSKSTKASTANKTVTQKTSVSTGGSGGSGRPVRASELGMWDDATIMAVRIPHDTIFFGPLLARGGYGEVYKGTYKGETVAIKQLLPERRKDLAQIDEFLGEVKLMASLDHERIVRFIGVAWNSLSDACAVVEYMENGDLRSVLTRWENEEQRPLGFDADKIKIALHIAHALTYLHSLQPVVVHRDLKSKNILLTNTYDAKLTDFGVSRERADSTMTAGVGSSLWMAPEVMMGERYNEKADVFSFGVVLSELDSHKLPYANVKETNSDRKIPDSAILQMVSLGRVRVAFSQYADQDLVQLAYDCVEVDPTKRPTSAEVLHRVHQASRRSL